MDADACHSARNEHAFDSERLSQAGQLGMEGHSKGAGSNIGPRCSPPQAVMLVEPDWLYGAEAGHGVHVAPERYEFSGQ